jgi:hypothetical protein
VRRLSPSATARHARHSPSCRTACVRHPAGAGERSTALRYTEQRWPHTPTATVANSQRNHSAEGTPRRATCSRRPTPNWSTTVARLSHTASQLHAQDRITPRSLHAIHNHRCSAVVTSPCQPRPRIARSPPLYRHFYPFASFALTRNAKIRGSKF